MKIKCLWRYRATIYFKSISLLQTCNTDFLWNDFVWEIVELQQNMLSVKITLIKNYWQKYFYCKNLYTKFVSLYQNYLKRRMKILHFTLKAFLLISISMLCITNLEAQVSYQYDNNGNRTAKVIVLNTLKNNDFAELEADNDDSIVFDDKLGESSVKIYPNPTKGLLRVDIQNDSEISGFIEIINNVGKTICKTSDISLENQLDLSNQPNGVYVMRIIINGKTSTWKIIKE